MMSCGEEKWRDADGQEAVDLLKQFVRERRGSRFESGREVGALRVGDGEIRSE